MAEELNVQKGIINHLKNIQEIKLDCGMSIGWKTRYFTGKQPKDEGKPSRFKSFEN